jgi:hypothetical protein
MLIKCSEMLPRVVVHTCNPSPGETKVGESQVRGQPGLYETPCQKKKSYIKHPFSLLLE